jgi:hypothetical protein
MDHFFETLGAVASHPLAVIGFVATLLAWVYLLRRIHILSRIIRELRALPANRRRYTLERTYRMYPGTDNQPIAYTKRVRRNTWLILTAWTTIFFGAFFGTTYYSFLTADAAVWELDDSELVAYELGYRWNLVMSNRSSETIAIERIDLALRRKSPHPETDRKRPDYPGQNTTGRRLAGLKPYADSVPVLHPHERYYLPPGETKELVFYLEAYHQAHEGWIYDVQLVALWEVTGETAKITKNGTIYRIGWPGLPHWSEENDSAGPGTEPVTDPVIAVSE